MVTVHADWSSPAFDFSPVSSDTGPFPGRGFLEAIWNHNPVGELCLAESGTALVPLVRDKTSIRWVGHPDLVDYRSPLGDAVPDLIAGVLATSRALQYRFDSLPVEAAEVIRLGLGRAGFDVTPEQHAVTARLQLPDSYQAYLSQIGKKQRHELRRKRRRFHEVYGRPALATTRGSGDGFGQFVAMHRQSAGPKGSFMTSDMEQLFASLAEQAGWQIDVLSGEDGRPAAATFSWAGAGGFYLYNSAYDQTSEASPGIVLLSMLIERAIRANVRTFDFLKGDEPYKFRLGATPRPLYCFEGST
jgi:CelD/BcsL family acetyltransferase involved in cellulose biosynthesis